jgi:hypothetical protein
MVLVRCKKCTAYVSDKARFCQNCGILFPQMRIGSAIVRIGCGGSLALASLFLLLVSLSSLISMCSAGKHDREIGTKEKDNKEIENQPFFRPGVEGRSPDEICISTSPACQKWTYLSRKCQENMALRDAGYMGEFDRYYCGEAESFREQVTGIPLSTSPGAFDF